LISTTTSEAPEKLAERIGSGDSAAEAALVGRFERGILQILLRETPDRELARDLTQQTFLIVLERLRAGPLEDSTRLAGYLAQTARNLLIAEKRRFVRRRTELDPDAVQDAADEGPRQDDQREADSAAGVVRKLLMQLKSERDRLIIVRFYLDEESKESICKDLALTELQFNLILFRARNRLRQLLSSAGLSPRDLLSVAFL
jgi:RNA polymerase sigma-70 factor (ECF subfamily)